MKTTKVQCAYCDKIFERPSNRVAEAIRKGWGQFCTPDCQWNHQRKTLVFVCQCCGKTIETTPSRAMARKYCSLSCAAKAKQHSDVPWRSRKCVVCGGSLKKGANTYCSGECHQESRYTKYVEEWLVGKQSGSTKASGRASGVAVSSYVIRWLRETRGDKCEECGWQRIHPITGKIPLQAHHLDGDGANNGPDNLKLLCGACHTLTLNWGGANKGDYPTLA